MWAFHFVFLAKGKQGTDFSTEKESWNYTYIFRAMLPVYLSRQKMTFGNMHKHLAERLFLNAFSAKLNGFAMLQFNLAMPHETKKFPINCILETIKNVK